MSSLLEEAEAILQRRKAERLAAVEDLATRHAAGDTPDPALLVEVTELAGVTLEDYSKKVEHRERRRKQLAAVAQRPDYEQQRATAEATMKEAGAKLEVAQRDYNAVYGPAWNEFQAAGQQLGAIATARQELRRTTKAPAIVGRANEITGEIEAAREREKFLTVRQGFLTREIARLEPQAANHEEMKTRRRPANFPDPRVSYTPGICYDEKEHGLVKQALDKLQSELSQVEAALSALPAAVAALEAEREGLLLAAEQSSL